MRTWKLLAKAALNFEQITPKHQIGCDGIEIQLLGELRQADHVWNNAKDVFELDKYRNVGIEIVHAPIIKGAGDTLIEWLVDLDDMKLLDQVFYIADYYGQSANKVIPLIVHSETNIRILEDTANGWTRLMRLIDFFLDKYRNVCLCIENVTPFRGLNEFVPVQLSNNFYMDNVEMCDTLRRELKTNRIGLVLDTCHQGITEHYMDIIYDGAPEIKKPDFTLEHYMKFYAPYMKVLHIADFTGCGYGAGKHGIPFTENTKDKLFHILDLKEKYAKDCFGTLEVEEVDYQTCNGYRTTKALVDEYYKIR